ncbi:MAG: sel1 repeat family protein [Methylocapsa sp.]|nr:sel1 repeat family protein [Methylocapsa sp.]
MLFFLLTFFLACAQALPREPKGQDHNRDAGEAAYGDGRFRDALRIWQPLAESGDPRAAFGLGLLYDLGEGIGQDSAAAYNWYRRAAEEGYVPAEFNVAIMCDSGIGTERNLAEAALWYARAAAHGYARAEYNLAQLYEAGEGVPRNIDVAKAWYAAAAAHGLSAAARKDASLRRARHTVLPPRAAKPSLAPAILAGPHVTTRENGGDAVAIELSWAAPAQSVPVDFYVQILAADTAGGRPIFARYLNQSATIATLSAAPADYAWRVYTVAEPFSDYAASAWSYFSVR